ncbi:Rrf2 family transcriptional regulator [Streptomyces sp. NPDC001414]
MSANSKLTIAVHILTWMSLDRKDNEVATSERLAESVRTNPVVIRRCLGQLRAAGLVQAKRGVGAGWYLVREPEDITLCDVHVAVDGTGPFALHHSPPNAGCPIGSSIGPSLEQVYSDLEGQMRQELSRITIADMLQTTLARGAH